MARSNVESGPETTTKPGLELEVRDRLHPLERLCSCPQAAHTTQLSHRTPIRNRPGRRRKPTGYGLRRSSWLSGVARPSARAVGTSTNPARATQSSRSRKARCSRCASHLHFAHYHPPGCMLTCGRFLAGRVPGVEQCHDSGGYPAVWVACAAQTVPGKHRTSSHEVPGHQARCLSLISLPRQRPMQTHGRRCCYSFC